MQNSKFSLNQLFSVVFQSATNFSLKISNIRLILVVTCISFVKRLQMSNLPLDETVRICADTLYSGRFIPPDFFVLLFPLCSHCSYNFCVKLLLV